MLKHGFEQLHPEFVNSDIDPLQQLFDDFNDVPLPLLSVFWRGGGPGRDEKRRTTPKKKFRDVLEKFIPHFGLGKKFRSNTTLLSRPTDGRARLISLRQSEMRLKTLQRERQHRRNRKRWQP
jgi:hypothetical protein